MKTNLKTELGKYLLDVSKLIFAGAVISGIMRENIGLVYVLPVGISSALAIAYWGFELLKPTKFELLKSAKTK